MKTLKPLPCPFCGLAPKIEESKMLSARKSLYTVVCANRDCGVAIVLGEWTEREAVEKWNRRGVTIFR